MVKIFTKHKVLFKVLYFHYKKFKSQLLVLFLKPMLAVHVYQIDIFKLNPQKKYLYNFL